MAADPTVIEIVVGGNTASVEDSSETIEVYSDSRDANSIRNRTVETGTPANQEVITWSSSASEWIYQTVAENVDDQVASLLQSSSGNGLTWSYNDSAGTLTPVLSLINADINASAAIAVSKLAASTVNYGGVTLTLGGSDTTPAFNLSDATAYVGDSALVTSGALNSGSITSGFGSIDVGSSAVSGGTGTFSSLVITEDVTVGDDLSLISDSAVLNFGENSDVSLTHVHDTGLLLNSTRALQFGDSGSYIQQAGDGVLRINGEGTVDIYGSSMVALSNDVRLNSDASVLGFGVDNDVTLTHVHDTGLLLNSTMAIQFNDASQYINAPTATVLDINATDEIELNATTIDINGTLDVSGTATFTQVDITAEGDLRLQDNSGGQYVGMDAPATVSSSYVLTMPAAVGSVSQVLSLSNTDGTLAWTTPEVGDITSVVAGAGMTGGGTSGDVTLNVIGTSDKITVSADAITIASGYVGQTSITTLGTVGTGTWQGSTLAVGYGGTGATSLTDGGVLLGSGTGAVTAMAVLGDGVIIIGDNSGDPTTLDVGSSSAITILGTIATGAWQGTSISTSYTDAKVTSVVAGTLIDVSSTTGDVTANVDLSELATSTSDGDGDFFAVVDSSNAQKKLTKGNISLAGFTGTAATATTASVATTVTITDNESTAENNGLVFTSGGTLTGNLGLESDGTVTYNPSTGKITATGFIGALTGDASGNAATATALQTARTIGGTSFNGTAHIAGGLAATATALATARAINGVDFDGTGAVTVTAAAGTLSGGTLASGVTASSLTSVGTLTSLTTSGNIVVGATDKIYLDNGGNTYLTENSADSVQVFTGGAYRLGITDSGIYVAPTSKVFLDGGSNTYILESAADTISLVAGGTTSVSATATGTSFNDLAITNVGDIALDSISSDGSTAPYFLGTGSSGATAIGDAVDNAGLFIKSKAGTGAGMAIGMTSGGDPYLQGCFSDNSGGKSIILNPYGDNVIVTGSLSKGGGSFLIPHPLPSMNDTHNLVHSFVEGPRADLIYRDSVTLSGGTASIDLDEVVGMTDGTWELLCRDPQVYLQNDTGWSALKGSVSGSTLILTCEDSNSIDTVSWMVVAERQDDFMKASATDFTDSNGRVILEPLKRQGGVA